MNDLLQLRGDLAGRYEDTVQGRRCLGEMSRTVLQLTTKLEEKADHIIRPDSLYWAALSNSLAGVVEAAQEVLEEAHTVNELPCIVRWFVNFCNARSFDNDVEEISHSFLRIQNVVLASDRDMNVQEKLTVFQNVGCLSTKPTMRRLSRMLSNIVEESESESGDSNLPQSTDRELQSRDTAHTHEFASFDHSSNTERHSPNSRMHYVT